MNTPYHRFQPPKTSKFGSIPPSHRIYINEKTPVIVPVDVTPIEPTPSPAWQVLGITENEYYETIYIQTVPQNAVNLELQMDNNEPLAVSQR
jgi:hypothetical protein